MSELESIICASCKRSLPVADFTTEKKQYKCCLKCRDSAKSKYTPKPPEQRVKREKYSKRPPPCETDSEFFCSKCHSTLPISNFRDENGKYHKMCQDCLYIQRNEYQTQAQPKVKIHCDICKRDICSTMYDYHIKSNSHAYHVQRQNQPQRRVHRKRIVNVVEEKVDDEKNSTKN
jgi:hypothetical protein